MFNPQNPSHISPKNRKRLLLIAVAITASATLLANPITVADASGTTVSPTVSAAPSAPLSHEIYGAGGAAEAEVRKVIDRFAETGLDLPMLRIYVHEAAEECSNNRGVYGRNADLYRVDICIANASTIGHELAHAWEHHMMQDATRQMYMDHLGVDEWNDHDLSAPARAMEQAAELIEWGMRYEPLQRISAGHYDEDLRLFEALTGRPSLRIAHWDDEHAPSVSVQLTTPVEIVSNSVMR